MPAPPNASLRATPPSPVKSPASSLSASPPSHASSLLQLSPLRKAEGDDSQLVLVHVLETREEGKERRRHAKQGSNDRWSLVYSSGQIPSFPAMAGRLHVNGAGASPVEAALGHLDRADYELCCPHRCRRVPSTHCPQRLRLHRLSTPWWPPAMPSSPSSIISQIPLSS
uniref:Uncharacterized protein n=1 Tax=Arundo donax TaxID=35708 RepID=A0A0A9CZJ0_ARUDO